MPSQEVLGLISGPDRCKQDVSIPCGNLTDFHSEAVSISLGLPLNKREKKENKGLVMALTTNLDSKNRP